LLKRIQKSLALKVSLTLALVTVPLTVAAAWLISVREGRNMERMTLDEGKLAATIGAKMYGSALEELIDGGYMTVGDAFDQNYEEIKGYDFGEKGKYHTRYDGFTDRVVVGFQDRFLDNPQFVYAVGVDKNGYLPTHNSVYVKPLVGDVATDRANNRTKRKFNNPVELRAASNTEPLILQTYPRDTGETMWDVAAPIYVKGKHWGGFRVGVSMREIAVRKSALMVQLSIVFAALALLSAAAIFVIVNRSMGPLERLSDKAIAISTGEDLETPIKPSTIDEVGRMTKSLDRLRASLRAAMERLGE
jgi:HAMP domain-containing protein